MDCTIFFAWFAVIILQLGYVDGAVYKNGLPKRFKFAEASRADAAALHGGREPYRHPGVNSIASAATFLASNFSIFNGKLVIHEPVNR